MRSRPDVVADEAVVRERVGGEREGGRVEVKSGVLTGGGLWLIWGGKGRTAADKDSVTKSA